MFLILTFGHIFIYLPDKAAAFLHSESVLFFKLKNIYIYICVHCSTEVRIASLKIKVCKQQSSSKSQGAHQGHHLPPCPWFLVISPTNPSPFRPQLLPRQLHRSPMAHFWAWCQCAASSCACSLAWGQQVSISPLPAVSSALLLAN